MPIAPFVNYRVRSEVGCQVRIYPPSKLHKANQRDLTSRVRVPEREPSIPLNEYANPDEQNGRSSSEGNADHEASFRAAHT